MIDAIMLVEGTTVDENELVRLSLYNTMQLFIGKAPSGRILLHVAAITADDLTLRRKDLLTFQSKPTSYLSLSFVQTK